ncbi:MAG: hypothetical protein DRO06_01130 [Thermoproteota archaeon]|nr:MAG: hypothetical protein DRO06_01130 [Candidatus Korarchaeota archaeon]
MVPCPHGDLGLSGPLAVIREILSTIAEDIEEIIDTLETYSEITEIGEIARRYAVTNAFDGVLTMLGVLVGGFLYGTKDLSVLVSAGFGGTVAMMVSGAFGTYLTERAERKYELKEMEAAVLVDLDESMLAKAQTLAAALTAIVSGLAPATASLLILTPLILAPSVGLDARTAFTASVVTTLALLFTLGVFLGAISRESKLAYGMAMVLMGLAIVGINIVLGVT